MVRWFTPAGVDLKPLDKVRLAHPVPPCSIAPLPAIVDPEAQAFENGNGPSGALDIEGLKPPMARALAMFERLVTAVGGNMELKSAYRPPAYQAHLQQVWFKWMDLRNNIEPGCQDLRASVGAEFARHHLLETQKPVTFSDHTRGLAFDATVAIPTAAKLKRKKVTLDRLAVMAGIRRPDILHDPVHFKFWAARRTKA